MSVVKFYMGDGVVKLTSGGTMGPPGIDPLTVLDIQERVSIIELALPGLDEDPDIAAAGARLTDLELWRPTADQALVDEAEARQDADAAQAILLINETAAREAGDGLLSERATALEVALPQLDERVVDMEDVPRGMVPIAGVVVGPGETLPKFDFQAIPQDYVDLVLKFHIRSTANGVGQTFDNCDLRINADAIAANYHESRVQMLNGVWQFANYFNAEANIRLGFIQPTAGQAPAGIFAEGQATLPAYSRNDCRKYIQLDRWSAQLTNLATGTIGMKGGILTRHASMEPVNRLEFDPVAGDFAPGSYMMLYGVMPGFI